MHLLVLPSPLHDGEVHSVDVDSSNCKLLTAGKDGSVAIWSLADLVSLKGKEAITGFKSLKSFKYHNDTVTIAKWCPTNNQIFASCDRSGNVYITDLEKDTQKLIYPFESPETNSSNVIDGSWSFNGKLFAWSTLDGKVHIYDYQKNTYQELTKLSKSEKPLTQRSIAFDPTDNYLVTLGDDTLIYVYQFQQEGGNYKFRLIHKISKLINKTPLNVKYKRISWSCDGEFVSVPTAIKNQTSLVSLISRSQNWTNKISLVGHDLNCEVVKFNPKIFTSATVKEDSNQEKPEGAENAFNIIATAGSDKTLVVWNTSKASPIFVLKDLVSKAIVDLCWDKSGSHLFLASLDGLLAVVNFEPAEIGSEAPPELYNQLKEFGKQSLKPFDHKYEAQTSARNKADQQIEILDQKDAIQVDNISKTPAKESKPPLPKMEQKEKPENKKTDIVPQVIAAPSVDESSMEVDDILQSTMSNRQAKPSKQVSKKTTAKPIQKEQPTSEQQKITTKNGKKRVQPLLISENNETKSPNPAKLNGNSTFSEPSTATGKSLMEFDKPSYSVHEDVFKEKKRLRANQEEQSTKKIKRDLEPIKFVGSIIVNPNTTFAKVRLSVPKVRLNIRVISKTNPNSDDPFILDIRNGQGNEATPTRITYFKKDKQLWCDFVPRYIQLVTEGSNFWALSTADGQILTYSSLSGRRILPPMIIGTPISFLESHGKYLMAVTAVGELYVWNIEDRKIHLKSPLSLSPLLDLSNKYQDDGLSKADSLTMCSITSRGIPLVTLSNGSGYLFNNDLGAWQTITESWWAFGSHYWDSLGNDDSSNKPQALSVLGGEDESSIVGLLENKTNEEILRKTRAGRGKYFNKISKNMIMKEGFENLENTISLSHLENRILCSELLGEFKDFKKFLITYAKRICELGFKAKLFEICNQLLGPVSDDSENEDAEDPEKLDHSWNPKVCGLDKHELLKEIILTCASNRDAQRVLIHFGRKIGILDELSY